MLSRCMVGNRTTATVCNQLAPPSRELWGTAPPVGPALAEAAQKGRHLCCAAASGSRNWACTALQRLRVPRDTGMLRAQQRMLLGPARSATGGSLRWRPSGKDLPASLMRRRGFRCTIFQHNDLCVCLLRALPSVRFRSITSSLNPFPLCVRPRRPAMFEVFFIKEGGGRKEGKRGRKVEMREGKVTTTRGRCES